MVALLRGVNVGGKARLAMADLRAIATDLGYTEVATYIQSGNLVLATSAKPAAVAHDLAQAIARETSLAPAVLVRTRQQLARTLSANPFLPRGVDPSALHITFTDGAAEPALAGLELSTYAPEEIVAIGEELHLFLPNGMGRSPLAGDLAKRKEPVATTRNLRTVTRLLEMAGG